MLAGKLAVVCGVGKVSKGVGGAKARASWSPDRPDLRVASGNGGLRKLPRMDDAASQGHIFVTATQR